MRILDWGEEGEGEEESWSRQLPPCFLKCLSKLVCWPKALSHHRQRKGFSCYHNYFDYEPRLELSFRELRWMGMPDWESTELTFSWMLRTWRWRFDEMEKDLSHLLHLYGCSPVCVLRCRVRFADLGNTFPQNLQQYLLNTTKEMVLSAWTYTYCIKHTFYMDLHKTLYETFYCACILTW